ncbi:uncharacterized protein TRAVEDRAFT_51956 [Trametes versicolor FP-101664 SS1]|uniref:uncharacterized protein n=1 Tax=Trametes versicolor (strain FP-101664) TaxID=717944 RepID=UPI0004622567|nr:uncharacterized protein TRAVEDRAFT_51956 [Trametes versicolor FP-101664 SS1]EIW54239.1 hypothetical protein TRAVEDRAFT_51956 [Trametes versicolor FP-101664 SS1]
MQIGGVQAAFRYSTAHVHLRRACEVRKNHAEWHTGSDTDGDFFQLERYGSSLVDESACSASQFSVPPQIYANRLTEVVCVNAIKKHILPCEDSFIITKASLSMIMPMFIVDPECGTNTSFDPAATESVINQKGPNRKHIFDFVKASSTHLQLEYIDVLQYHRFNYTTPIAEAIRADDASSARRREGGIPPLHRHKLLLSLPIVRRSKSPCCRKEHSSPNISVDYAIAHNLTPLVSIQNDHSPMYRKEEREMFPTLTIHGVGSIPWSPLARGLLSRPNAASSKRGDADPGVILSTQSLAQDLCHTSPRAHIRKSEQVDIAIPGTTGIHELFKHAITLCARDTPPSVYDMFGIVVVVVKTKYDIFSNTPGFAFPAAEDLAGHSVLALYHKSAKILCNAKSTLLCVMAAPELELARSQAQKIPKLTAFRSWTAYRSFKSADHDPKYALLTHAARYTGIPFSRLAEAHGRVAARSAHTRVGDGFISGALLS